MPRLESSNNTEDKGFNDHVKSPKEEVEVKDDTKDNSYDEVGSATFSNSE